MQPFVLALDEAAPVAARQCHCRRASRLCHLVRSRLWAIQPSSPRRGNGLAQLHAGACAGPVFGVKLKHATLDGMKLARRVADLQQLSHDSPAHCAQHSKGHLDSAPFDSASASVDSGRRLLARSSHARSGGCDRVAGTLDQCVLTPAEY